MSKVSIETMIDMLRFKAKNIKAHYEPEFFNDVADELEKYQWIDVKDRLPQKETYVLVCFDDGFIATVFFGEDFELWLDSGEPIAWMPLPEPYKKEVE